MKFIAFSLAMLFFGQSWSKCPLVFDHVEEMACCQSEKMLRKETKSCHKTVSGDKNTDSHEKKDCCKDGCHCFCCMKVISNEKDERLAFECVQKPSYEKILVENSFHSFDYHKSLYNPPQL
ncbi:MAG: hypothetical protein H6567_02845 [Lewinellaceae bacterium]|nr:hypothetical protein [Lewinellaceae bacterium]